MNCPNCRKSHHIEIDLHADGFAENLQECGDCGAIWTERADARGVSFKFVAGVEQGPATLSL